MLFGREIETTSIDEALGRAFDGHPQLVTIEGLEGLGKSTLAAQCVGSAIENGFTILECSTDEFNGVRPFGPLLGGFRRSRVFHAAHKQIRACLMPPAMDYRRFSWVLCRVLVSP